MTDAEQRLAEVLRDHQESILVRWTGYEKILLFELARALDSAAFGQLFAFEQGSEDTRRTILLGGATALLPLLERVKGTEGGVPWLLADEPLLRLADSHLHYCGRLANLLRLAALERYGLAKSTFVTANHLRLEIVNGDVEYEDMHAVSHVHNRDENDQPFQLFPESAELLRRIDAYVDVEPSGLIRYDNDEDLIEYYSTLAARRARWFLEGEALPPDAVIGGRSFARWLEAAVAASGRELQHIAFAIALASKRPELSLRNLVTLFVRRDDLHDVLLRFDEPPAYALELVHALTLDEEAAAACIADYEVPVPFYIDFGRDFVLLPCLGALLNPVATLVRFLRSQYRADWDRAVERREDLFRADVRALFPQPRFDVSESGITLRRQDRSVITDIDAVVLDKATGSLALIQLKWHDIYGRSLRERDSRRRNLLEANKWVTRVWQWIDGRSAAAVAIALRVGAASEDRLPYVFVVSRYAAQFAGNESYDEHAAWIGWGDLRRAMPRLVESEGADLLGDLAAGFRGGRRRATTVSDPQTTTFDYPNLTVEICVE